MRAASSAIDKHTHTHAQILVIEGLHPFYDPEVAALCDLKIYLDISDEIKFAWKIQRDMAERGEHMHVLSVSLSLSLIKQMHTQSTAQLHVHAYTCTDVNTRAR